MLPFKNILFPVDLPTHGLGAFRRSLIGSITAKVLHDAECPVWTGVHLAQAPPLGLQSDLLIIGRSPASGVLGRLRTHAYSIIRRSPCPVLSV
jgi:nucleotide-binding universal stress UspA family protein